MKNKMFKITWIYFHERLRDKAQTTSYYMELLNYDSVFNVMYVGYERG